MSTDTLDQHEQIPPAFHQPGGNLLRPAQMAEHQYELDMAKSQLEHPRVQDKGAVRKRIRDLTTSYEQQAPRPITDGKVKDQLRTESEQLLREILPGMLSQEEMRKNPAGSVDRHIRWERANKARIMKWKKIQCLLNADNSNPTTWNRDAANLEQFRPVGAQDRMRLDAQISGHMTYGSIPEENWARTFGSVHPASSALNQAVKVHDESAKEQVSSIAEATNQTHKGNK